MYVLVILPLALENGYYYKIPDRLIGSVGVGHRVLVHFGAKRIYTAIVADIVEELPKQIEYGSLRFIDDILDNLPILSKNIIDLMWWISDYYICPIGVVLQYVMPLELMPNSKTIIRLNKDFIAHKQLTSLQNKILDILSESKGNALPIDKIQEKIDRPAIRSFEELISLKAIYQSEYLVDKFKPKTKRCVVISENLQTEEHISDIVNKLSRSKAQQQTFLKILSLIYEGDYQKVNDNIYSSTVPVADIAKGNKNVANAIKSLLDKNIIIECFVETSRIKKGYKDFETEFDVIDKHNISELKDGVNLYWAINSYDRENEICLRIRDVLNKGKNVLLLSPSAYNMPSSNSFLKRIESCASPNTIFYYHRYVSTPKRVELFKTIMYEENPFLVVGTRSALFLPINNLGLIIVDQEHEFLYKEQQRSPRYHTRDVTVMRALISDADVLLTSETPSVETVFNSLRRKYHLLNTDSPSFEYDGIKNVSVDVIDIAKQRKQRAIRYDKYISNDAIDAIKETLSKKQKVLVLHNRRGYTPYMICNECGKSIKCPNCDVSLNFHREQSIMICHYCGYMSPLRNKCDNCGYTGDAVNGLPTFRAFGIGSQRVEDEITQNFPDSRVLRLDSDSLQNKQEKEYIHKRIENDEVDIIIGTPVIRSQPIWNNIGLILVVQLESIIGFPDFRATERAFQLIYGILSSAISGQMDIGLKLIVQTNNIDNPFIETIKSHNYNKFVHTQLSERELFKFSPFYRLTKIIMRDNDRQKLESASSCIYSYLKNTLKNSIVSPAYSPYISRIDNKYCKEILIRRRFNTDYKTESAEIKKSILQLTEIDKSFNTINIVIDRDPI